MQYLVNNRIYDTEKAEKIISYSKSSEINRVGYLTIYKKYKHTLYKTKKDRYFVIIEDYKDIEREKIELLTETEVKDLLCELNAIDKYKDLFGNIEEG